jgi:hypothetical protein
MSVTNDNVSGATASGWSAAIDQAAAGRMIADDDGEQENEDGAEAARPKRLLIVSAGNVTAETDYANRRSQDEYPIEDPRHRHGTR